MGQDKQESVWTVRVRETMGTVALPVCRPGVCDSVARQIYLGGQTAFLALALHDHTGGQIWGALNRRRQDGRPSLVPGHFAVETEPGYVTDIEGTTHIVEWQNRFCGKAVPFSREDLRRWQRNHQAPRQWMGKPRSHQAQYKLAESFVDLLLRG